MIIKLLINLIMLLKVMAQDIRWRNGEYDKDYWVNQLQDLELEARSLSIQEIDTT